MILKVWTIPSVNWTAKSISYNYNTCLNLFQCPTYYTVLRAPLRNIFLAMIALRLGLKCQSVSRSICRSSTWFRRKYLNNCSTDCHDILKDSNGWWSRPDTACWLKLVQKCLSLQGKLQWGAKSHRRIQFVQSQLVLI